MNPLDREHAEYVERMQSLYERAEDGLLEESALRRLPLPDGHPFAALMLLATRALVLRDADDPCLGRGRVGVEALVGEMAAYCEEEALKPSPLWCCAKAAMRDAYWSARLANSSTDGPTDLLKAIWLLRRMGWYPQSAV